MLGSSLAAFSTDATMLIASRALMGLGAAGIMPTTLSILTNIFPASERPKAIAAWAAVAGLGIALGPISGGFLIEHFAWSSIFLVNLPVVVACLIGAAVLVPDSRDPASPNSTCPAPDCRSRASAPSSGPSSRRPSAAGAARSILAAFGAGAAVIAAFIAWERRTDHPMLDVTVFRNLRFSAASVSIAFVFFALMGVMYCLTTYLQSVLGNSARCRPASRCCRSRSA